MQLTESTKGRPVSDEKKTHVIVLNLASEDHRHILRAVLRAERVDVEVYETLGNLKEGVVRAFVEDAIVVPDPTPKPQQLIKHKRTRGRNPWCNTTQKRKSWER